MQPAADVLLLWRNELKRAYVNIGIGKMDVCTNERVDVFWQQSGGVRVS